MVRHVSAPLSPPAISAGAPRAAIGATLSVICSGVWLLAEWLDEQQTSLFGVRSATPQEVWLVAVARDWRRICGMRGADGDAGLSVEDWIFWRATDDRGLWAYHAERCGEPPVGEELPAGVLPSLWIESLTGVDPLWVEPQTMRYPDGTTVSC